VSPCFEPVDLENLPTEILVEGLWKSFGGNAVLQGVDLEIRCTEIVAIVGGSGAGKTVLLDHMVGLLRADRGRVRIAHHGREGAPLVDLTEISERDLERLRTHWALVFQKNALLSGTVYENIAVWLREQHGMGEKEIRERAEKALDQVGLASDDSMLNRTRDQLSGGMAKRVAVARALAMDPNILFYDEPTTGLDPKSAGQIHELICETHGRECGDGQGQTTVIVTHDKDLLRRLRPRVAMLHQGKVYFDGPYDEFEQSDSEIIRPYFEAMPVLQQTAPV